MYEIRRINGRRRKERDDIHEKTKNIICECVIYKNVYYNRIYKNIIHIIYDTYCTRTLIKLIYS